ncbi:MAG: DUF1214 domain-containing protein [Pseudomonadota bacterium]
MNIKLPAIRIPQMNLLFHKVKKRVFSTLSTASDIALFTGIVLIGGLGSSWYMVSAGSALSTHSLGPWVAWTSEGRADADPYTRAHFARHGRLNLSSDIAATYTATYDQDGIRLHSSCEYRIAGPDLDANWWSISVFDHKGRLIPNSANRYAYTRDTVALRPTGDFMITLARDARPGNWLPTAGAGRLAIVLQLLEPSNAFDPESTSNTAALLPDIEKVSCR